MPGSQLFAIAPADALALTMVAVLSFALGMIVTILLVMARSGSNEPRVDTEIFEEKDEESHNVEAGDQPKDVPREEWEQDPDWWKKSG